MWVQTHQGVLPENHPPSHSHSHSRGAQLPGLASHPPPPPPALTSSDAFTVAGDAAAPAPQLVPGRTSVLVSKGSFLILDDPPAAIAESIRESVCSSDFDNSSLLYHQSVGAALSSASSSFVDPRNDSQRQPWPPPRKESLSDKNSAPWIEVAKNTMDSVNIAVIGANGAGKSAFIQRALRLSRPPNLSVNHQKQEIEGIPYHVTLVELDLEVFDVDPDQPVQWPKQIGGHIIPRMDGALVLYDVTNRESIRDLPLTMNALANSALPTILVATKCDTPENLRVIDTGAVAAAFPACISDFKTSSNVPGTARECFQAMLRAALAHRRGAQARPEGSVPRRRAASAANLDAPQETINGRPISQHSSMHSRASSDLSLLRGFPPPPNEGYYRSQLSRSPRLEYQNPALPYNSNTTVSSSDTPEDGVSQTVSSMLRAPGIRLDGGTESFLDVEESDAESFRYSDDIPILHRNDETFVERPAKQAGVTFDELVDRLIAPRMSRADSNFANIFLCLYRKFAAPGELFAALRARLDRVQNDKAMHLLTGTEAQMRIIEVVAKWVSLYPGDFARPVTRRNLEELIRHLSTDPATYAAAQQMRTHLEQKVVEDDDTGWAKSDDVEDDGGMSERFSGMSVADGGGDGRETRTSGRRQSERVESMSSMQQLEEPGVQQDQRRPSQSSELSGSDHHGRTPARFQFHSFEDYEREAATMVPTATLPLNKIRYRIFMDVDPDDIADEITRIDWVMFSSIRIRDMVRSVSLTMDQKEKCRSLKNVNRMVAHFNHVAKWVANMVLIRDKAKHRAPCLEKFMNIALKLRQLNNYNGLAAVLAGINGTAVHRLTQTRNLVSPEVQKRFARLVLLMGTAKSHFAYRLAWENSPLPRIPFMPLHRRDLVSAEEGSRTFVGPDGDRINWKKFEVLGEVLLPIMKSQGQPYPNLHKHELSRELILDCRMATDDEDIYQRSTDVEPTSNSESNKPGSIWLGGISRWKTSK
ncbi:ras guanine nucleotide exchange factor A [Diplogelasinospora grovesii]|uniref:Ras guanine nucleotide exchange factor A n=1 Tax=Diplogelasinospora grovesii TaxID=303347 RepID=A0AAN6NHU2_9PEZI|nr:ras guanine nucleotide exchange factor A [Diplogelasinospora grovesii]